MTGNGMGHCKKTDMRHIVLTMVVPLILALSVVAITASSVDGSDVSIQDTDISVTETYSDGNITTNGTEKGSMMLVALGILSVLALSGLAFATRSGWKKDSC